MKVSTKNICYIGIGIALYFVLSMTLNIPLIGHLKTDLGYIAFGVWCVLFGWQGCIVGVVGCLLESLILSGWFPVGWILGQIVVGLTCGIIYKKCNSITINVIITIVVMFVGIAGVKTLVECHLYSIPFVVKLSKNLIAAIADTIPMLVGLFVGNIIKRKMTGKNLFKSD